MHVPTGKQLDAFGRIINYYADAETGIKIALAGMLEIDMFELLVLTEPYSSLDLRNVAKSIAKHRFDAGRERDQFCQLVGDLGAFGPLRNNIAHSRWTKGERRGSIKPHRVDIRSGVVKFHGAEEGERDWTTKELQAEVLKLLLLNRRIVQFMQVTGIAASIFGNTSDSSDSSEESEGSSSSDS